MRQSEPIDVRRLLTRFVLLVVLPTAGLVAFGVLAISNERAVVEKRFLEEYTGRLRTIATRLASEIDVATSRLAGEEHTERLSPLVDFAFSTRAGRLSTTRPLPAPSREALSSALANVTSPPDGAVAVVPVASGPARGLYAVRSSEGGLDGLALSDAGLTKFVSEEGHRLYPGDPARYELARPQPASEPSANPMRRLLEEITQTRQESGLASFTLPAPLSEWRLVATLPGGDPVRTALWRNRTIYIVALVFFYLVITTGVVVTLRGIAREARLSRLKTDFVTNISHELRTPLTSIRLFAETLRLGRATTPEERDACLDFIVNESERLTVITERTLEWGRLEAGRRKLVRERASIEAIVDEVAEGLLQRGVLERGQLVVEKPESLPDVLGDAPALGQVFVNLFENAVKYRRGEPRVVVRYRPDSRRIRIEVEDNGIGIARRDQKRIFDRFYRADDLLARRTEGSGLGLSIARRIVEIHGGRLTVKSRPGNGSTFTVELPVAPAERADEPARETA